jgi:hypothetical protein
MILIYRHSSVSVEVSHYFFATNFLKCIFYYVNCFEFTKNYHYYKENIIVNISLPFTNYVQSMQTGDDFSTTEFCSEDCLVCGHLKHPYLARK